MNMSHQLRTPMNTILGFSDSLLTNDNLTLMNRYSGTISTLQELHPEWSMTKIMDKIRKLEEE